jgi:hypothetical protein
MLQEKDYYKKKADEVKLSLKSFPDDFIKVIKGKKFDLPSHNLIPGKEFFGSVEVTAPDGAPWYISDDISEAKYLIYARQNGRKEVTVPEPDLMNTAVSDYEYYLDLLMKEIGKEFRIRFPEGESSKAIAEVFRLLNLVRY